MTDDIKQSPEWQISELAVQATRNHLVARGCYVLRTDLSGDPGAPGFIGPAGFITVADLLVAKKGTMQWHEVKWKTRCDLFQKAPGGPAWRTGIDAGKWRYYLWLQKETGIPGWLSMVHLRPGPEAEPDPHLFTAPLNHLSTQLHEHEGGGDVKVWWDVDSFRHYPIKVGDEWKTIDLGPPSIRPWERKSKDGVAPRWMPK